MDYKHTQTSIAAIILAIGILLIVVGLIGVLGNAGDDDPGAWAYLLFIVVAGAAFLFNRLTVTVAAGTVDATFGFGWPRHSESRCSTSWPSARCATRGGTGWGYVGFRTGGCTTCGVSMPSNSTKSGHVFRIRLRRLLRPPGRPLVAHLTATRYRRRLTALSPPRLRSRWP